MKGLQCIPIYIQQDATLHSLFISGNCCTCFGWYLHPSSGAHTTVSTASGICQVIQQDATLHSLFISGNCSICFGWHLHPSSGTQTTASKASGICQVIQQDATLHSFLYLETALHVSGGTSTHHQERIQLYLQHLVFVRLLSAAIAAGSSNGLTNTRCCRYSCMRS